MTGEPKLFRSDDNGLFCQTDFGDVEVDVIPDNEATAYGWYRVINSDAQRAFMSKRRGLLPKQRFADYLRVRP